MSGPSAPRPSAWAGLEPLAPRFEPAPPELARRVEASLGARGRVERIANAGEADAYLRFTGESGRWFVKVVPPARAKEMEEAERIARWLAARGAPVVAAAREPSALGDALLIP